MNKNNYVCKKKQMNISMKRSINMNIFFLDLEL